MAVGPDVEIGRIVFAQIDRVGQHLTASCGTDEQPRCASGCIVGVLLFLVGNRSIHPLSVGQHVVRTCGPLSRQGCFGTVGIVVGIIGRRAVWGEHHRSAGDGNKLHRFEFHVRRLGGKVIRDFRYNPLYGYGRQLHHAVGG